MFARNCALAIFALFALQCLALAIPSHADDLVTRQRPGHDPQPTEFPPYVYESIPDIESSAPAFTPVPDRWREFYAGKWYDPYNQNVLKADLPVLSHDDELYFVELSAISDTLYENRRLPFPVGSVSSSRPESNNTFGRGRQNLLVENVTLSASVISGNTSFKPPDFEFRVTPVFNVNSIDTQEEGITRANPLRGADRTDDHIGFLELFIDKHLTNISDRYDFISARVGIQRFVSDFRGFIYSDEEPGVRLFGNWDNNRWQYNLAWFHRLDKDTNSAVNSTFDDRYEDVVIANLFRQDAITLGQTVQGSVVFRNDQAGDHPNHYDDNGVIVRPASIGDERSKNLNSTYLGLTTDGHIERINSTGALYYVTGSESHNPIAQQRTSISAAMAALELSYDIDWLRLRTSFFWASGDDDPYDGDANGFDAVFDNPNFAGGDLSFWQRQGIGFIGGGGVNLVNRNSLLPDLRAGKEEGQSNFVNPGLRLYNVGADFEILPELKFITNGAFLQFDKTAVIEALRQDGSISRDIGLDLSAGLIYRPFLTNNIEIRTGAAILYLDDGLKNLFQQDELHSLFTNFIFQY